MDAIRVHLGRRLGRLSLPDNLTRSPKARTTDCHRTRTRQTIPLYWKGVVLSSPWPLALASLLFRSQNSTLSGPLWQILLALVVPRSKLTTAIRVRLAPSVAHIATYLGSLQLEAAATEVRMFCALCIVKCWRQTLIQDRTHFLQAFASSIGGFRRKRLY